MRTADIEQFLVRHTERILAWRKRRRLRKKERQKRKNQILDWVQALLWAAVVVLIVNQYLLQAYAVPSASMEDTILGEDRLFVDKFVYGPEIVPGYGKLPGAPAKRGEIIVFLNPDYQKEMARDVSPVEELVNRLLYMLTFTLVNRDVNAKGEVAKHFLVKRLIGLPGEKLRLRDGRVEVQRVGEIAWTPEESLKDAYHPIAYTLQKKFFPYDKYDIVRRYVELHARLKAGLAAGDGARATEDAYLNLLIGSRSGGGGVAPEMIEVNYYYFALIAAELLDPQRENPTAEQVRTRYQRKILGDARVRGVDPAKLEGPALEREYRKFILAYNGTPAARINALSDEALNAAFAAAPVKFYYNGLPGTDEFYESYWYSRTAYGVNPGGASERNRFARRALGWYVPTDRFFPMGDNRDNSKDARYFGSVKLNNLLGRSLFRFWPLHRIGAVE